MDTEKKEFFSDGVKLQGAFFRPKAENKNLPLVIMMSGFTGLYTIHPARFARFLTMRGYTCFSFDYRGFGESEGEREHLLLEEQVRDVRNAAGFAQQEYKSTSGTVIAGWGMGAGVIIKAAYYLNSVKGLCALNGFFDGYRFLTFHRGRAGMQEFEKRIEVARQTAAKVGEWPKAEAFDIYPLDSANARYVDEHLRVHDNYSADMFSLAFGDSLLSWKPEAVAPFMEVPIWIAHGTHNLLHSPEESDSLYNLWKGDTKELYWIEDSGHTEWMLDEHPTFQRTMDAMERWIHSM